MSGCILRNLLSTGVRFRTVGHAYRLTSCRHMSFLSSTYSCTEPWKDRLKCPILAKADANDFIIKVQDKIERQQPMSPLDIDIIANRLTELSLDQMDFVQSLFKQFRKTQPSTQTFQSTPYAIVRNLLENGDIPRLIEMLQDKLGYGIFLEPYTANLLLDYCIEHEEYQFAADVAFDQMLQEDFSHPITRALSWYACHLYWKNPPAEVVDEAEDQDGGEEGEEEEEETKYIPINFIENPYYDDHFDLPTDKLRLGKTLVMLTKGQSDLMGNSYQLLGWGLYEKFDKGLEFLKDVVEKGEKESLAQELFDAFKDLLHNQETKETPEQKEAGLMTIEDLYPYVTAEQKMNYIAEFEALEQRVSALNLTKPDVSLASLLRDHVTRTVSQHESSDMAAHPPRYSAWTRHRGTYLERELEAHAVAEKKRAMTERLLELRARDEKLRFFERRDSIELGIASHTSLDAPEKVGKEEVFVAAPGERGRGMA